MDNSNTKIGDIFYSSWGYEQTNICFYQVIKIVGKCSVDVRRIKSMICEESTNAFVGHVMPQVNGFIGDTFRKRILDGYDGKSLIKISSCQHARPWDGNPKMFTSYA